MSGKQRVPDPKIIDKYPEFLAHERKTELETSGLVARRQGTDAAVGEADAAHIDAIAEVRSGGPDERAKAKRAADAAKQAQAAAELYLRAHPATLKRMYDKRRTYRDEHLKDFLAEARAAHHEVDAAVQRAAQAVAEAVAVAAECLPKIDYLRPVPYDGVVSGVGARLSRDLDALRVDLAAVEVLWPQDVNRQTGEARDFAAERQRAFADRLAQTEGLRQAARGEPIVEPLG